MTKKKGFMALSQQNGYEVQTNEGNEISGLEERLRLIMNPQKL